MRAGFQPRLVRRGADGAEDFEELDGASAAIRALKRQMLCVARDPHVTVLVLGESGTGKERVARAIHRASPRARAPFVVVDCASLSASLAEDALYGHVRGAFTGAVQDLPGPFERANGGTVLLDEIGDLSPELQMKLLRAVQARAVQRLGGRQEARFDVRIIASTNVDLAREVKNGRFREDLYYRLKVYDITVPPLRARGAEDVEALAHAILTRLAAVRRRPAPALSETALERLVRHDWPGNVRELENTLERMLVEAGFEGTLTPAHLPERFDSGNADPPRRPPPSASELLAALDRHGVRIARTAAALGLSRHQLYRLRQRYGIRPMPPK